MRVIINADDCGKDPVVNKHIEDAIIKNKISSTTIMANMDDFEGAIQLYNIYHDRVSFGAHLNFTEGQPLIYSQVLLDLGFYIEENGKILMNGSQYRNKILNKEARHAIYLELKAQLTKIRDASVTISHIDSHHFIHHSLIMLPILPKLCKEFEVKKTRRVINNMPASFSRMMRNAWPKIISLQRKRMVYTDWFDSFGDFMALYNKGIIYVKGTDSVELMCHPGGIYEEEEKTLLSTDIEKVFNSKLINYYQL